MFFQGKPRKIGDFTLKSVLSSPDKFSLTPWVI